MWNINKDIFKNCFFHIMKVKITLDPIDFHCGDKKKKEKIFLNIFVCIKK